MAYNKFTVDSVQTQFDIQIVEVTDLFGEVPAVTPSVLLKSWLAHQVPMAEAIGTEKAKSEFIVAPILSELRQYLKETISLFSGVDFNVDRSAGLTGRCDFIISDSPLQLDLSAPILMMVEAKNDNLNNGLGQCMAEMIAAQRFNQLKDNETRAIFGCVTTGSNWLFLKLEEKQIQVDKKKYFIGTPEIILGILVHITKMPIPLPSLHLK
jgi:hypothetical protein